MEAAHAMPEERVNLSDGVDLDLGVVIRKHPDGGRVCMYKKVPGAYMDWNGDEVSAKRAKEAGFSVNEEVAQKIVSEHVDKLNETLERVKRLSSKDFVEKAKDMSTEEIVKYADSAAAKAEMDMVAAKVKDEIRTTLDDEFIGLTNQQGAIRGTKIGNTKLHEMKHITRKWWNVIDVQSGEIVLERVNTETAIDWMIRRVEEANAAVAKIEDGAA